MIISTNCKRILHLHQYQKGWFTNCTTEIVKQTEFCKLVPSHSAWQRNKTLPTFCLGTNSAFISVDTLYICIKQTSLHRFHVNPGNAITLNTAFFCHRNKYLTSLNLNNIWNDRVMICTYNSVTTTFRSPLCVHFPHLPRPSVVMACPQQHTLQKATHMVDIKSSEGLADT